jgi:AsmA protein
MAGVLDNPDSAYAKLREMGKGLFGPDGAGLGSILDGLGLGGATAPDNGNAAGNANPQTQQPGQNDLLGGSLGEAIGNLIQQGLSGGAGAGTGRSRSLPATPSTPAPQASPGPPPPETPPAAQQDSQPMNDVLRQLFNR